MSQPPTYARQYSFLAYQVSNPEDPLPGQKVDQELNAAKVTLDAILTNLALIQRDDGRLANNSVGTSQLDGALISLGFERPTSWATTTAYAVDDAVFQSNKLYICLIAHTSGTFATDLAALKWEEVIDFTSLVTDAEAARDDAQTYAAAALASKNAALGYANDIFGGIDRFYGSTTGTNNYTVATQTYQPGARASGFEAWFYVVNANSGAVNIAIGGYADDDVKNNDGSELVSGEWPAGSLQGVKWHDTLGHYVWINSANPVKYARLLSDNTFTGVQTFSGVVNFDAAVDFDAAAVFDAAATFNAAASFNSTFTITSTDAGADVGPNLTLDRFSASPAASDNLAAIAFRGRDSTAAETNYATVYGIISDPTNGSEDGQLIIQTMIAGTNSDRLKIGAGVFTASATGGDQGVGTINATGVYDDGVLLTPGGSTLLGTITTTSGTEQTLSGLTLTSYKFLKLIWRGVSTGGTVSFGLGNSGSDDVVVTQATGGAGGVIHGTTEIELSTGKSITMASIAITPGSAIGITVNTTSITNASTAVFLDGGGGTLDAGSIDVYGIK